MTYSNCSIDINGMETNNVAPPRENTLLPASVDVQTSGHFACALGADGLVRCVGVMPFVSSDSLGAATLIPGLSNVQMLAVSANANEAPGHACALDAAGAAWCWGNDYEGQLGDGTPPETSNLGRGTPVRAQADASFVAVTAGGLHTCAIDTSHRAWCWGAAPLGDGTMTTRSVPTKVLGLPGPVIEIAAGAGHTCALLGDRTVWCWGENTRGEVGNGTYSPPVVSPARVAGVADVVTIGLGAQHTCAIESDHSVWCWGSNAGYCTEPCVPVETGQLGVSGILQSAAPVRARW
jgi:alpha-tubulin suppressor-like RCC1 family protein